MPLLPSFLFIFISITFSQSCPIVTINWSNITSISKTITTLQVVANPVLNPATSPIASTAWNHLAQLNADLVRYVPWFPYPKVGVAELQPPTLTETFWSFVDIEPQFRSFMAATYGKGHTVIPNFSTQPTWMYDAQSYDYPVDPNKVDWGYPRGPAKGYANTTTLVSEYYGRLLSWIVKGSFTDEHGQVHNNTGDTYKITHWEVFNEPEGEHRFDVVTYTVQYDAIVREVRRVVDPEHLIQFVGLALEGRDYDWITYFLNPSNHHPEALPITYFSFHFYASCDSRTNPDSYEQFFSGADDFLVQAKQIVSIRDSLSPHTKIDVDEMGVILPNDNDVNAPVPPVIYWNAAGAMYAYLYGKMSALGYDVLGQSQFAGCPAIPEWDIYDAQFPSVSLVNWTNGVGNARYWVLDTLLKHVGVGDKFVSTEAGLLPTLVFCADLDESIGTVTLRCADKSAVINMIQFSAYGTPTGTCQHYATSNCNANNVTSYVSAQCLGKNFCSILSYPTFGDPCFDLEKKLVIQATCSGSSGGSGTPSEASNDVFVQAIIDAKTSNKKILLVNKKNSVSCVTIPAVGGSTIFTVDEASGEAPARKEIVSGDTISLAPFAVSILYLR